ncbi:MAG: hypothetical protein JNM77_13315 [Pseudonocardia sp.]|nr:hypothetical protein [Pseudonocardia sp.]
MLASKTQTDQQSLRSRDGGRRGPNQSSKLAIVTGANSRTGKEAARGLAGAGAREGMTAIVICLSAACAAEADLTLKTENQP